MRRPHRRTLRLLFSVGDATMNHTEADYITAGYRYEVAKQSLAEAQRIRHMLESETPEDQTEARRLIEQGRQEARK